MKHELVFAPTTVERIKLEVTPEEFLTIFRRFRCSVARHDADSTRALLDEKPHKYIPESVMYDLDSVARELGII